VVALKNPAADSQPAIEKSQQQMILESPYARSPHLWRLDSATIPAASSPSTDREHHGEHRKRARQRPGNRHTRVQNARSGPGLSADRRYLTLVAVDRLPNTSQPSGWQGATGSSLRVDLYQQPVG
jgi:hypothetical protein